MIFSQNEPERECDAEFNEKNEGEVLGGDVLLKKIPKKCYPNRSKVTACRELLNQMKSFTFVVYDNDALDQLYESLSADLKDFSHHEPVEDNLVAETSSYQKPGEEISTLAETERKEISII